MPQPNPKQQQRIDGIVAQIDEFLDRRFAQARRIRPELATVETDMRVHLLASVREMLAGNKGFGPVRLMVADILSSSDEAKKRDLFNTVDQVCILREIVPEEKDVAGSASEQVPVYDVKSLYEHIDPRLGAFLNMVQVWVWWDLRDAAECYRFGVQENRIENLRRLPEIDEKTREAYRNEMGAGRGAEIDRNVVLKFELDRTRELVEGFAKRLAATPGYQIIPVLTEREGTPEADALCVSLAKRLTAIERLKNTTQLDDNIRQFYAGQLSTPPDKLSIPAILAHENMQAGRDRNRLTELLSKSSAGGKVRDYKALKLEELRERYEKIKSKLDQAAAPANNPGAQPETPEAD